jgi:rubrerythrin
MPLSPADQARPIRSKDELVALAHALEVEAAARYRELAERMRLSDEETLARLFLFLASVEEKHVAHIDRRSLALLGHLPAAAQVRWELPETFDEEAARSARLTPYDALAVAVRNEERAFAFYAYVAAGTDDPAVQDFAEELAKDELEHAVLLRRERRRAFRAGPRPDAREGRTQIPGSPEELQALSSRWSAEDARAHAALADALDADGNAPLAAAFRQIAAEEGTALAGPPQGAGAVEVRDGLRLLERAFDRYADIAEHARDEAVVSEAQRLAERVLRHLALAGGTSRNALIGAAERPAS